MKKYLLVALILVSQPALADFWTNCTNYGGTIITANSYGNDKGGLCNDPSDPNLTNNCNGKRFCRGRQIKTWWSAFTWCEAIGGKLISFSSLCPGNQTINSGTCANVKSVDSSLWGWTNLGWSTNQVLQVNPSSGAITGIVRTGDNRNNYNYAFCEE